MYFTIFVIIRPLQTNSKSSVRVENNEAAKKSQQMKYLYFLYFGFYMYVCRLRMADFFFYVKVEVSLFKETHLIKSVYKNSIIMVDELN